MQTPWVSWGYYINYKTTTTTNTTYHSQHKWSMRSSISVLLRCKHSLMPSRISSNSFIIPAWADVCPSGGSNWTRPSMTARRAQLRPSDPVTLVLALATNEKKMIFSEEKKTFTYLWRRLQCWLLKDFHWLSKVATADEFCMADLKFSTRSCSIRYLADWHVSHINPRSGTHRRNSRRFVRGDLWRHLKQWEILRSVY